MNKIIFLDIDGVLNSNLGNNGHEKEISGGTLIDPEKIQLLSELVKNTGAKIVLHSDGSFGSTVTYIHCAKKRITC